MKMTATMRLVLFAIITFIVMLLFLFVPDLNMGSSKGISIYQEIQQGFPLMPILTKLGILTFAVFFGLMFLFGLNEKPKK